MEELCTGKVAVVGNGPISEEDRQEINRDYDCVVRFNDMKTYRKGDALTVQVSRDVHGYMPGVNKADVPLWPVAHNSDVVAHNGALRGRNVLDPLLVHESSNGDENEIVDGVLFPGCDACDSRECRHSESRAGPSTGALVLNALERSPAVDSLHVYGMNWNGGAHHVDFKHPNVVADCCTKCVIHRTANEEYDDRSAVEQFRSELPLRVARLKARL
tara:strand:+ start:697 stop:1344 length:648 start_codon:yes stop_codon:yes gene_type:complete